MCHLLQSADKMDSLNGATLIKADGSKVEAEKALENKVRPSISLGILYLYIHILWYSGPRPLLLLGSLVSSLQAVHPHAEWLLRRGLRRPGDCLRVERQVPGGHDLLHEGVARRLVRGGAQLCSGHGSEAEVRSAGDPHVGGGEEGRDPGHQGRQISCGGEATQAGCPGMEGLNSTF